MARIIPGEEDKYQTQLNGEWFSLKNDKDVARVQFMHDTYEDMEIFACHKVKIGDKERYVDCIRDYNSPIDDCPLCAAGYPVKVVRFIIMYQHDDQKVKIWERGKTFISKLQGMFSRYSPLSDYVFEIERHGVANDKETKYEIFPMQNVPPVDLTGIEKPELLGGLILEKDFGEMDTFLQTGEFPNTEEAAPVTPQPARRVNAVAPTARKAPEVATTAPSSRRGGSRETF